MNLVSPFYSTMSFVLTLLVIIFSQNLSWKLESKRILVCFKVFRSSQLVHPCLKALNQTHEVTGTCGGGITSPCSTLLRKIVANTGLQLCLSQKLISKPCPVVDSLTLNQS